jgi:hypothetical protein
MALSSHEDAVLITSAFGVNAVLATNGLSNETVFLEEDRGPKIADAVFDGAHLVGLNKNELTRYELHDMPDSNRYWLKP